MEYYTGNNTMGRLGNRASLFYAPKGALTHHFAFRHSGGISYGKRALSEGKPFEKGLSENFYHSLRSAFLRELIAKMKGRDNYGNLSS